MEGRTLYRLRLICPLSSRQANIQNEFLTPLPTNTQNGRVAGLVVSPFCFPKFIPKSVTSNPLSQIATSNSRLQPNTYFAVDMFPYKKTGPFQMSGLTSQLPKKPGNTPLSGTYLSFLDIKTTVSTCNS